MPFPERLIESAQKLLQPADLLVLANPLWGSDNPTHQALLHKERDQQKTTQKRPHHSISHTHNLGILALASSPLGVDVEITARVEERIVARVSSSRELLEAPHAASLWCAKEACFKALRSYDQPSVISKITIGGWEKIDSQTETFKLLNFSEFSAPSESHGLVLHSAPWCIAFFIFRT